MGKGGNAFLIFASVATASCAASSSPVAVRAIPDPAAKLRMGDGSLAEAQAQLALGNTGLALEAFRKVIRTQGDSAPALAGIGACYAAMGRYDIARVNYEAALALSPRDASILRALADTLEPLGKTNEAAETRAEAASLMRIATSEHVKPADSPKAVVASAAPTPVIAAARPPVASAEIARLPTTVPLPPAKPAPATRAPAQERATGQAAAMETMIPSPPLGSKMSLDLPPVNALKRMADQGLSIGRKLLELGGFKIDGEPSIGAMGSPPPRLERLSLSEVALVTTNAPLWRTQVVARSRVSTTVRWVPIQLAQRPNIRVLNAARKSGLAARGRDLLIDRGWRRIDIGDAGRIRATSLVLYPASRKNLGRSLAAQFRCASMKTDGDVLVVLLGRDSLKQNILPA